MKIENPLAFRYILQDDVYLLNSEKDKFTNLVAEETVIETPVASFNYLGGNKKNFVVLVHYNNAPFMHEPHLNALENTLKRLNFLLDDIAIVNVANYKNATVESFTNFFNPQKVLILGENALLTGYMGLTLNNAGTENNCTTLYTFSFDQMMDNTENKKIFWEQMKQL